MPKIEHWKKSLKYVDYKRLGYIVNSQSFREFYSLQNGLCPPSLKSFIPVEK